MFFRFEHFDMQPFDCYLDFNRGESFLIFDDDYCHHCASANPGLYYCAKPLENGKLKRFGCDGKWLMESCVIMPEPESWKMMSQYALIMSRNSDEDESSYWLEVADEASRNI